MSWSNFPSNYHPNRAKSSFAGDSDRPVTHPDYARNEYEYGWLLTIVLENLKILHLVKIQPYDCLGRYRVESEVGRGAMGVVYRARDPKIERDVAIKTISLAGQDSGEELEYRERFLQEARAAGRLSHPGIVAIFDASEDPSTREPFLVMEYVPGEPLSKILRAAGGKLPAHDAL